MREPSSFQTLVLTTIALLLVACASSSTPAQTEDGFGDAGADPVKLFERAQSAHARGEFDKALELYEQAIKVRPEFPEAEFQRGNVLVSLAHMAEAEAAFRRAIQLKKNWSLPYSALGALLFRNGRDREAEPIFREALVANPQDNVALFILSEIRLRAGDAKEGLELARRATRDKEAPASAWIVLVKAETANGDKGAAKVILDRMISDEPGNLAALIERADLLTEEKNYEAAVADLKAADKVKPGDKLILSRLAFVYQQAGKLELAQATAQAAGLEIQQASGDGKIRVIGTPEEIEAANSDDPIIARKALEKLLEKNPHSGMLLARLGASFRTDEPGRSLEFYRRAATLEPNSSEYAVGYASALVQARRFLEAVQILGKALRTNPQNYTAHANLATALYELKRYADALPEYEWLITAKPDLVVVHYFIATAHDYLGEYPEALASYEKFLAGADSKTNQLEVEKVKLRLPSLHRQIQLGEGVKRKP
jgi:tetratricopeptide (TPR) repeat protein